MFGIETRNSNSIALVFQDTSNAVSNDQPSKSVEDLIDTDEAPSSNKPISHEGSEPLSETADQKLNDSTASDAVDNIVNESILPPEMDPSVSTLGGLKSIQCIEWLQDRITEANLGHENPTLVCIFSEFSKAHTNPVRYG